MKNKRKILQVSNKTVTALCGKIAHLRRILKERHFERITLRAGGGYLGYHMDCNLLQQGPVAAPVSIFWRFAVASVTMLTILLMTRRLRPLAMRDHLFCMLQGCCVFALTSGVLYRRGAYQYRP